MEASRNISEICEICEDLICRLGAGLGGHHGGRQGVHLADAHLQRLQAPLIDQSTKRNRATSGKIWKDLES